MAWCPEPRSVIVNINNTTISMSASSLPSFLAHPLLLLPFCYDQRAPSAEATGLLAHCHTMFRQAQSRQGCPLVRTSQVHCFISGVTYLSSSARSIVIGTANPQFPVSLCTCTDAAQLGAAWPRGILFKWRVGAYWRDATRVGGESRQFPVRSTRTSTLRMPAARHDTAVDVGLQACARCSRTTNPACLVLPASSRARLLQDYGSRRILPTCADARRRVGRRGRRDQIVCGRGPKAEERRMWSSS